jgi:hypothetical protein
MFSELSTSPGQSGDLVYAVNVYMSFVSDRLSVFPDLQKRFQTRTNEFSQWEKQGDYLSCVLALLKFVCDFIDYRNWKETGIKEKGKLSQTLESPVLRKTHRIGMRQSESSFKALIEESQKLLTTLRAKSPNDLRKSPKRIDLEFSPKRYVSKRDWQSYPKNSRSVNASPEREEPTCIVRTKVKKLSLGADPRPPPQNIASVTDRREIKL